MKFSRRQLYKANSRVQIIIVLAILVVINILGGWWYARWDMTQGKEFSISDTTKNILRDLDDVVAIKAYFTTDLPGRLLTLRQQVDDILAEYTNYGGHNIQVNFIDPGSETRLQQEVQSLGIPPVQFSTVEQDKYQVSNGYLGMAILYGDQKEIIPVIKDTTTLEYELTSAIKKVTSQQTLTVAFTTGNDEISRTDQLQQATQYLNKQYTVTDFDLSTGDLVPSDIQTLIVAQPKTALSDRSLYVLDQFIMRGGSILFLVDGVSIGDGLQAQSNNTGLDPLLASYGIHIQHDLVLDGASNDMASFSNGYVQFYTPYPFFIKAIQQDMEASSPLVNHLESITLPWASSVQVTAQSDDKVQAISLVKTTPKAWTQTSSFNLDPQQTSPPSADSLAQYSLAVSRFGQFDSYFKDQNVPAGTVDNADEAHLDSTDNGRVIVVGDGDFITDSFLQRNSENLVFFSNLVDGLSQDVDLINIRSKAVTDRPLADISYTWKQVIKYLNIFLPTLLITLFGLFRLYWRRRISKQDNSVI
ncbi:MAG: GldG family protein [Candidatus Komeilibacteria bacterium]